MNTGTVAVVRKDKTLPSEMQTKLIGAHKSGFGFAVFDEGEILTETVLSINADGKEIDLGLTLSNVEESFKTCTRIYHFSSTPDGTSDIQPFSIIKDGNDDILVAVAEGDFPGYAKADSSHSNAYHMVNDYLSEVCKEVYQEADEDVDKMMTTFETPRFRKGMLGILSPRGVITLIGACDKDPTILSVNQDGAQFDWGYLSNTPGFRAEEPEPVGEPVQEPVKELSAKEKYLAKKAAEATGTSSAAATGSKIPQPEVVGKLGDKPKKDEELVKIDSRLIGRARKRYLKNNFKLPEGNLPQDWETKELWPVSMLKPGSALKPFTKSFAEAGAILKAQPEGIEEPSVTTVVPPVIGPAQVQNTLKLSKEAGFLQETMDPEKMASYEKHFPTFTERTTIPFEEWILWDFPTVRRHFDDKQAAACSWNELRFRVLKHEPNLLKIKPAATAVAEVDESKLSAKEKYLLNKQRKAM